MNEQKKSTRIKSVLSAVYLLLAVCLTLGICGYCYPQINDKAREIIAGAASGPVQEAFCVLTDGLGDHKPVREVLSQSYEVLKGETN